MTLFLSVVDNSLIVICNIILLYIMSNEKTRLDDARTGAGVGGLLGASMPLPAWLKYRLVDYKNMQRLIETIRDKQVIAPGAAANTARSIRLNPHSVVGVSMSHPTVPLESWVDPRAYLDLSSKPLSEIAKQNPIINRLLKRFPNLKNVKVRFPAVYPEDATTPYRDVDMLGSGSSVVSGTGARHGFGIARRGKSVYHGGSGLNTSYGDMEEFVTAARNPRDAALTFKLKNGGTAAERKAIRAYMREATKRPYGTLTALRDAGRNLLFPFFRGRGPAPTVCPPGAEHHCGAITNALLAAGKGTHRGLPGAIVNNPNLELDQVILGGPRRAGTAAEAKTVLRDILKASAKGRNRLTLQLAAALGATGMAAGGATGAILHSFRDNEAPRVLSIETNPYLNSMDTSRFSAVKDGLGSITTAGLEKLQRLADFSSGKS